MSEWQPIETAPKDGTDVLVTWRADDEGPARCAVLAFIDGRWTDDPNIFWVEWDEPHFWMPLPEPPK